MVEFLRGLFEHRLHIEYLHHRIRVFRVAADAVNNL